MSKPGGNVRMSIYVFSKKEALLKKVFPQNTQFIWGTLSGYKPESSDISYLDVSDLTSANIKVQLAQLKKICKKSSWGIIDTTGKIKDTAALFFEGASDYLGPAFFKPAKAIDPKRIKAALRWKPVSAGAKNAAEETKSSPAGNLIPFTGIKFPPDVLFPGWKNMKTGKTMPFYLLHCSLRGNTALITRFGEKVYAQLHQRFVNYLFQNFQEGEGLAWIDSGKDCLFLIPPKAKNAKSIIKSCMRALISAPLVAVEVLGLTVPVNFVFALHYGTITYKPPGKTGTVVSDAVNYVFHLGPKKAEPGRLTVSDEIPEGSIPKPLEDWFVPAGAFEGRKIWHTKKISYVRPWF